MIILHAAFIGRNLLLWGEDSAGAGAEPQPKRRGRKAKNPPAAGLPFAAGGARLSQVLSDLGIVEADVQPCLVWLPTSNGVPFPPDRTSLEICPWLATALSLSPSVAVALLCLCHGDPLLAPGIMAGSDLLFWGAALRLAGALVSRQQYLPGLAIEAIGLAARWQPVLNAEDGARLAQLANAMPSACRAVTAPSASAPPTSDPLQLLASALAAMTDTLVRETPIGNPPPASTGKTATRFASLHDQWLYRLHCPDAIMSGGAGEIEQFLSQVHDWHRPAALGSSAPFRLCFRLEEPADEGARPGSSPICCRMPPTKASLSPCKRHGQGEERLPGC